MMKILNKFEYDEEECFKEEITLHHKLDKMRNELIEIRKNQQIFKSHGCIFEQFDLIIDELESLRDKFGGK